jgi:ribosomal protein S11
MTIENFKSNSQLSFLICHLAASSNDTVTTEVSGEARILIIYWATAGKMKAHVDTKEQR